MVYIFSNFILSENQILERKREKIYGHQISFKTSAPLIKKLNIIFNVSEKKNEDISLE